jgi:hypothetical protein
MTSTTRYRCDDIENVIGRCEEAGFEFFEGDYVREDQQEQRRDDGYQQGGPKG